MQSIRWVQDPPVLRRPMLVLAFEGWNDAGDAASGAATHLIEHFGADPVADLDPEPYYDFSASRPFVRLDHQGRRQIDWPSNEFTVSLVPEADRDLIVLRGVEPQLKWRTFSEQVVEVATSLGVELVITLGALIADVVHSRPITVYGTSHDAMLCEQLDLEPSSYEGPTGIVGVVHHACQQADMASMSLWAAVPSYVPHASSPKASLALVERLGDVLGVSTVTTDLVEQAEDYEQQINELVDNDDETRAYVAQLERQYDESMRPESTAELIEELEEFLRDQ